MSFVAFRVLVLLCCLVATVPAMAQRLPADRPANTASANGLIVLKRDQRARFTDAFTAIANVAKVAIVAEGCPLRPELTESQMADLSRRLPDAPMPLEDVVREEAAVFDYDAERFDAHTFLLRKRYTDPNDLPCVTFAEVVRALENITEAAEQFGQEQDPFSTTSPAARLAESLTPEQVQRLQTYLPAADLTHEQRRLALAVAMEVTVHQHTVWLRRTLDHLKTLDDRRTVFLTMDLSHGRAFGYQGPFGPHGITWHFPLGNRWISFGPAGGYAEMGRFSVKETPARRDDRPDPASNAPLVDLTAPTSDDHAWAVVDQVSATIGNMLPQETAPPALANGKTVHPLIVVDDAVAGKPLTVFGGQFSDRERTAQSIAALYGLRLMTRSDGAEYLTMPTSHLVMGVVDLPSEILRLTPQPLLRAHEAQAMRLARRERDKKRALGQPVDLQIEPAVIKPSESNETAADNVYYFPAVRRLLALVAPKDPAQRSAPFPVASTGREEHRLIAIAMLGHDFMRVQRALKEMHIPVCVLQTDRIAIALHVKNGVPRKPLPAIFVGYVDDTGAYHTELSLSVPVPPAANGAAP